MLVPSTIERRRYCCQGITVWFVTLILFGCGSPTSNDIPATSDTATRTDSSPPATSTSTKPSNPPETSSLGSSLRSGTANTLTSDSAGPNPDSRTRRQSSQQTVAEDPRIDVHITDSRPINEALARSAGIRKLSGRHIVLYTDLPSDPSVDILPQVFDQAVPQWADYFSLPPEKITQSGWQVTAFLMAGKEHFQSTGLLPEDLPQFLHGYQRGNEIWIYEQPSEYYRRHLVLHEGTHAFMRQFLGSAGPPWYREGVAEFLGTHRWSDHQLTLGYLPQHRDEVPYWGRIKIARHLVQERQARMLDSIMSQPADSFLQIEAYGWSWAAVTFLDQHPQYQERFRQLAGKVTDPHFTNLAKGQFDKDWEQVSEEWQLFMVNLEYGYDLRREAVTYVESKPWSTAEAELTIQADRGWQSTGLILEAGKEFDVSATGRYVVANAPAPWWCEPNGVTLRYHQGKPLGMLLYAIQPTSNAKGLTALARPGELGIQKRITPKQSGTLFLRINDSPAELADNTGTLSVRVSRVTSSNN